MHTMKVRKMKGINNNKKVEPHSCVCVRVSHKKVTWWKRIQRKHGDSPNTPHNCNEMEKKWSKQNEPQESRRVALPTTKKIKKNQ